tara:strand:+ start:6789 stop:8276 length:1488 start_codon:yes stop_codon:yes gene_type:complete
MPTIKTIKPAGDGDFTSLSAWEDYADGQASAAQWAECYSGGNIGVCTLQNWSATPNANDYPKIYASSSSGHSGSVSSGAYLNATGGIGIKSYIEYVRIEGLRIEGGSNSDVLVDFQASGTSRGCRVEKCLLHGTYLNGINIGQSSGGIVTSSYATNNIIILDGSINVTPKGIQAFSTATGGSTTVYIYNNSIYVSNPGSFASYGTRHYNTSGSNLYITVENNIAIGGTYFDAYTEASFNSGSRSFNNNISSDGTSTAFGGLNNLTNRTGAQIFNAPDSNDFSLSVSSAAINAGKTIDYITTDILGTSRPQSTAYDIGAIEKAAASPSYFEIPESLINLHEFYVDGLIEGPLGQDCRLIYPVTKNSLCPNCIYSPRKKTSSGIYKTGGPIPFPKHSTCPWCGGSGKSSRAIEETVRFRVYWSPKDWAISGPVEDPGTSVMIIGNMTDLPKLEKSDKVMLNKDIAAFKRWICERSGEAVPWGLAQDRYFSQMLRRVG